MFDQQLIVKKVDSITLEHCEKCDEEINKIREAMNILLKTNHEHEN